MLFTFSYRPPIVEQKSHFLNRPDLFLDASECELLECMDQLPSDCPDSEMMSYARFTIENVETI
jgi:hypothetical protein